MAEWIGWRVFPPKRWWTTTADGKRIADNWRHIFATDPYAHILGGFGHVTIVFLLALGLNVEPAWWVAPIWSTFLAFRRQEWLVELWSGLSKDGAYPAWRAMWCTMMNLFASIAVSLPVVALLF